MGEGELRERKEGAHANEQCSLI